MDLRFANLIKSTIENPKSKIPLLPDRTANCHPDPPAGGCGIESPTASDPQTAIPIRQPADAGLSLIKCWSLKLPTEDFRVNGLPEMVNQRFYILFVDLPYG